MTHRIHNFSAGPAALPTPVLEQVQAELLDFQGEGMSIMEMSHRSKAYDAVHEETISDLRKLLGIPDSYRVLFMGGGARTQFALLPTNLLAHDQYAEYLVTGTWAEGAFGEARKLGDARSLYDSKDSGHNHVPEQNQFSPSDGAAYLHYTSNNTIYGTQYSYIPEGPAPLVCDMSSDILSRPIDVSKFGAIYAGAQKNMGPAGVTVLIVREDLLERSRADLPEMFSYAKVSAKNSLLNTPPVFAIYILGLVLKHLLAKGGLDAMAKENETKATKLYSALDEHGDFFRPHARENSRSQMNVTFRLPNEDLEKSFVQEATNAGLVGLKGHRSVGGIRASIYNSVGAGAVDALLSFMNDFRRSKV